MSWLPDPPRVLALIQDIKKGENLIKDSSELFWLFNMSIMNPEKFRERTLWWINKHLEDAPKGGGFMVTETRDNILQGPDKLAQVIIDKLDKLSQEAYVPYQPDEKDDPAKLYIHTHIESSLLSHQFKVEGYSDKTRELLNSALDAFNRYNAAKSTDTESPFTEEHLISIEALGSFLYTNRFLLQKSDGDYEGALQSLKEGISHIQTANALYHVPGYLRIKISLLHIPYLGMNTDFRRQFPWIRDLSMQNIVDCFEAIRTGRRIKEPKEMVDVCDWMAYISGESWLYEGEDKSVNDSDGNIWDNTQDYWNWALGWMEAQFDPSEFYAVITRREDQEAEQRLKIYFFEEKVWTNIPPRTRSSLITADREFYSGRDSRTEATLNELKIATEEVLFVGLWKPLEAWFESHKDETPHNDSLSVIKAKLNNKRKSSNLRILANVCKHSCTKVYLSEKKIPGDDTNWLTRYLPARIHRLHDERNIAEHQTGINWKRQRIGQYYNEFIGVGQPGILPRLCRILFIRGG